MIFLLSSSKHVKDGRLIRFTLYQQHQGTKEESSEEEPSEEHQSDVQAQPVRHGAEEGSQA